MDVCIVTTSDHATEALGRRLAPLLAPGTVVALQGELGTGKTVLTRGIARGLGITEPLTSPTFTIAQEYQWREHHWLFHLDMYRIDSEEEALAFGIEEYLFAPDGITVIEWPERIQGLLDDPGSRPGRRALTAAEDERRVPDLLRVLLEHDGPDRRRILVPRKIHEDLADRGGLNIREST